MSHFYEDNCNVFFVPVALLCQNLAKACSLCKKSIAA